MSVPEHLGFLGLRCSWLPRIGWTARNGMITVWLLFWGLEFEEVQ